MHKLLFPALALLMNLPSAKAQDAAVPFEDRSPAVASTFGPVTNWSYLTRTDGITGATADAIYAHAVGKCEPKRNGKLLAARPGKLSHITLDLYATSRKFNDRLKKSGVTPICYANFGGYENWRPDSSKWKKKLKDAGLFGGCIKKLGGGCWPGELWIKAGDHPTLREYARSRLAYARSKGCGAVELDNLDGYGQGQGKRSGWISYARLIADECRNAEMPCGFKNAVEIAPQVAEGFDFVTTERCRQFKECKRFKEIFQDKPRLNIEYEEQPTNPSRVNDLNLSRGDDTMKDALTAVLDACTRRR